MVKLVFFAPDEPWDLSAGPTFLPLLVLVDRNYENHDVFFSAHELHDTTVLPNSHVYCLFSGSLNFDNFWEDSAVLFLPPKKLAEWSWSRGLVCECVHTCVREGEWNNSALVVSTTSRTTTKVCAEVVYFSNVAFSKIMPIKFISILLIENWVVWSDCIFINTNLHVSCSWNGAYITWLRHRYPIHYPAECKFCSQQGTLAHIVIRCALNPGLPLLSSTRDVGEPDNQHRSSLGLLDWIHFFSSVLILTAILVVSRWYWNFLTWV